MASDITISDCGIDSDPRPPRTAYLNGRWVDADKIMLSSQDLAVTQAVTAVERIRAYRGRLFQIDAHLDRWARTTEALAIDGLPSLSELSALIDESVSRNQPWVQSRGDFGVLMFASPGRGAEPTLVIDLYSIDPGLVRSRIESGSPVVITSVQQPDNACWPRNIKVRCRLHYYLADRQAEQTHPGALGILVDADGSVTECSIANVLIVEQDRVICPQSEQILSGISLQTVRRLASDLGIEWRAERISAERFYTSDEVLLTGTSCGIWFANSLDGSKTRSAGPLYRRLRSAFDRLVATTL